MNEKYSRRLRLALFASVLIFIITVSIFFSTSNQRISTSNANDFNHGWLVFVNDEYLKETTLPEKISAEKDDVIMIQQVLNDDFNQNQIIMVRGSLQTIKVTLDGQIIYQKSFEDNAFNTYASLYHFVDIPENSQGKTVEITSTTPYGSMSGTINEVYYGSHSALRDHLLNQHELKLYIAIFLLIISIIFIISSYIFFINQQSYQIYLGVFGLFIGLWLFAESKIVQIYFNNDFLIGSLAYLSLATAPIAATAFIKYYIFYNKRRIYSYLCLIYTLNLLVITILHVSQILSFFQTVTITLSLIGVGFIIMITHLIIEYIDTKKNKYRNYAFFSFIFSIFILLEMIVFVNKDFITIASFASTGIATILLIVFLSSIYNLVKKLRLSFEHQVYEKIANTDHLTKAGSRFAFEKEFDKLFYDSNKNISLIYFDFDDLKHINDHFGHFEGDKILIQGYESINQIFGDYGKCYRIGGDEFACLTNSLDENKFKELKIKLKEKLKNIHLDKPYTINISTGYTKLDLKVDKKPSDLILRADKEMYQDKRINKTQAK